MLFVEQVSHHPPITAFWIRNAAKGLTLQGHSAQRTSFSSGSIIGPSPHDVDVSDGCRAVKQVGHAMLTLSLPGGAQEQYLITLPKLRIDGILYGSPYIELMESSYIQSSTGWLATIEYKGRGYFSGKSHSFKATLEPNGGQKGETATFEGQWDGKGKKVGSAAEWLDVTPPKVRARGLRSVSGGSRACAGGGDGGPD